MLKKGKKNFELIKTWHMQLLHATFYSNEKGMWS